MPSYAFRLLNVFAESTFGGNPLCVFEDAQGMSDDVMLKLARQFNLSETTFILPSDCADAYVRIFTPGYEMRFAGHPTLGSAQVVRELRGKPGDVSLEFKAGVVPATANNDIWTFTAPCPGGVKTADPAISKKYMASLLGLAEDDLLQAPIWVDTGADQLLVPPWQVAMHYAVRNPIPAYCRNGQQVVLVEKQPTYLFLMVTIRPQAANVCTHATSLPKRRRASTKTPAPARHALIWAAGCWRNNKSCPLGYSSIKANTCKDLVNSTWTSAKRAPFA